MFSFRIGKAKVDLTQIYYLNSAFVIADHPETKEPALFIRSGAPKFEKGLAQVGMSIKGEVKEYQNIKYYELEENNGKGSE